MIIAPCGACRQFISEFGSHCLLIIIKNENEYELTSINELLPKSFDRNALKMLKQNE
jgi:cytidine deaminase